MKRVTLWTAPVLAVALAAMISGYGNPTAAQPNSGSAGQARQSNQDQANNQNNSGQPGTATSSSQPGGAQPTSSSQTTQRNTATGSGQPGAGAQVPGQPTQMPGQPQTTQGRQPIQSGYRGVQPGDNTQQPGNFEGRTGQGMQGRDNQQRNANLGVQFGVATDRGLTVNSIDQGGLFISSGLRQGDVIIAVGGRPIRSQADFVQFVSNQPGQRIPVVIVRDGREETIYFTYPADAAMIQQPIQGQAQQGAAHLGVTFDTQISNAAVIRAVTPGSPAEQAGLQPGDQISGINGRRTSSYRSVVQIISTMRPGDQIEIDVLKLQRTQAVLQPRPAAGAWTATGDPRGNQNVQQSNFQQEVLIQPNQGPGVNTNNPNQPGGRDPVQRPGGGLIPPIRN